MEKDASIEGKGLRKSGTQKGRVGKGDAEGKSARDSSSREPREGKEIQDGSELDRRV